MTSFRRATSASSVSQCGGRMSITVQPLPSRFRAMSEEDPSPGRGTPAHRPSDSRRRRGLPLFLCRGSPRAGLPSEHPTHRSQTPAVTGSEWRPDHPYACSDPCRCTLCADECIADGPRVQGPDPWSCQKVAVQTSGPGAPGPDYSWLLAIVSQAMTRSPRSEATVLVRSRPEQPSRTCRIAPLAGGEQLPSGPITERHRKGRERLLGRATQSLAHGPAEHTEGARRLRVVRGALPRSRGSRPGQDLLTEARALAAFARAPRRASPAGSRS